MSENPCVEGGCDGKDVMNVFVRSCPDFNGTTTVLDFHYQIQTTAALSMADIQNSTLPLLEEAMVDVLRNSFAHCSREVASLWLAAPADTLLPGLAGVTCQSRLVPAADRCLVFQGALTIPAGEAWAWRSRAVFQHAMEQGRFNDAVDAIPHVSLLSQDDAVAFLAAAKEKERNTLPPSSNLENYRVDKNTAKNISVTSSDTEDAVWAWVVFPVGAVLLVVLFVAHHHYYYTAARQKKRQQRQRRYLHSRSGGFPGTEEFDFSTTQPVEDTSTHAHDILWDPHGLLECHSYGRDDNDDDDELYYNSITSSTPDRSSACSKSAGWGRFPTATP